MQDLTKRNSPKSLAGEYIARAVVNISATSSVLTGHSANFQTAFVLEHPWSLKATDQSSLDDALSIACRYIAERPEEIDIVRSVLSSRVFLAKLGKVLGLDSARLIKKGQPMLTIDMLLDAVRKTNRSMGVVSEAADLIMMAILGRALTGFGFIRVLDGLLEVEIEDGLIPDWTRLKAESIQRELETVFGSVSFDNAIDASQTVGSLLLPPLTSLLRQLVSHLEEARNRLLMTDILGAASFVYLQDLANKSTIFNGLLTNETVARMSTNLTFVGQFIKSGQSVSSINALLACAPSHTVAAGMAKAAQGITAAGRIKEVDLVSFQRNTEVLLLRDLNHMPTRLFMAASYQAMDYKPQVSLFERQDTAVSMLPLGALEDALAQYIPSLLRVTTHGTLASFANALMMIEGAKFEKRLKLFDTEDAGDSSMIGVARDCCTTSGIFTGDKAITGLMMTEAYLEHYAVSVADEVIVKNVFSSDGLCAVGVSEVDNFDSSMLTYVTTKKAPDFGDELFSINDASFVTQDPAIVVAFGVTLSEYEEALDSWKVGPQVLSRDMRLKDVIGKVIAEDGDESDEYLVPNAKSSIEKPMKFTLPAELTGADGVSIEINLSKSLTGVDYGSLALGSVYMHQLPVLRALTNATFSFLIDLLDEDETYAQQVAVAVTSFLTPLLDNVLIHKLVSVGKTEILMLAETCVERRMLASAIRRGVVDAHMATQIHFELLRKMQLIDNDLYKQLSEHPVLSSQIMTTLLSSLYRKNQITSF